MGWAARARAEAEELRVANYRVRCWTAYQWRELDQESRSDREQHLERVAGIVVREIARLFPMSESAVSVVRVGGSPQLLFEMTVAACDERDARWRAMRRFERASSVKIPTGPNRRTGRSLNPPWGECRVERSDGG